MSLPVAPFQCPDTKTKDAREIREEMLDAFQTLTKAYQRLAEIARLKNIEQHEKIKAEKLIDAQLNEVYDPSISVAMTAPRHASTSRRP